jgi:nuclease S1
MQVVGRWAPIGLVVLFGVFLVRDVYAWGDAGHEIVCEIAFQELTAPARTRVLQLLQPETAFSTFSRSCTWPDGPPRLRGSEHFVNLPRSAVRIENDPCPLSDKCVVTAIDTDFEVLSRTSATDAEKLAALKFLGHWVGDVHQPLHVSFKDDRGGNEIDAHGPCTQDAHPVRDLHAVWDTCIIAHKLGTDIQQIASDLRTPVTAAQRAEWTNTHGKDWANESFALTTTVAVKYCIQTATGCRYAENNEELAGDEPRKAVTVDEAYMELHLPTIKQRLTQAGIRLGGLLNRALGGQ